MKTFYLKFDLLNHQLTYFSNSYKDFKYLQEESADVLENTYIEIKDCPFLNATYNGLFLLARKILLFSFEFKQARAKLPTSCLQTEIKS